MTAPCLVIDTSIQGVATAVCDLNTGRMLYYGHHPDNMGSVVAISGLVEAGFKQAGIQIRDLTACVVAHGPGSFTGIKIGLAFAYGLKMANGGSLPMLGLSALESVADMRRKVGKADCYAVFLPATRTHGFLGIASKDGVRRSQLVSTEDREGLGAIVRELGSHHSKIGVLGDWPLLNKALVGLSGDLAIEPGTASEMCEQAIHGMAERAIKAWPQGFGQANPQPQYHRLSTAEERLQQLAQGDLTP